MDLDCGMHDSRPYFDLGHPAFGRSDFLQLDTIYMALGNIACINSWVVICLLSLRIFWFFNRLDNDRIRIWRVKLHP